MKKYVMYDFMTQGVKASVLPLAGVAHSEFGSSVNPIPTKGGRLYPPHYWLPTRIWCRSITLSFWVIYCVYEKGISNLWYLGLLKFKPLKKRLYINSFLNRMNRICSAMIWSLGNRSLISPLSLITITTCDSLTTQWNYPLYSVWYRQKRGETTGYARKKHLLGH